MALASRILSKSNQICKWNTAPPIMLFKDRVVPVRYFSNVGDAPLQSLNGDGDPSTNDQPAPESSVEDTKLFPSMNTGLISRLKDSGFDFEHWKVYTEPLEGVSDKDEKIHYYIKTLAQVLGSEEEAVRKIYSVATTEEDGYAFGANVSDEIAHTINNLENVTIVLPDAYDPITKRYPWDPFINGQALQSLQRNPKPDRRVRISPRRLFRGGEKQ